jgi:hypothetical protein
LGPADPKVKHAKLKSLEEVKRERFARMELPAIAKNMNPNPEPTPVRSTGDAK